MASFHSSFDSQIGQTGAVAVFCNAPDAKIAHRIAKHLVESNFAACVSILPSATAIYRWQGTLYDSKESPLMIKTTAARLPDIKNAVRQLHPDDTPELIAVPIVDGFDDYLQWVQDSVLDDSDSLNNSTK